MAKFFGSSERNLTVEERKRREECQHPIQELCRNIYLYGDSHMFLRCKDCGREGAKALVAAGAEAPSYLPAIPVGTEKEKEQDKKAYDRANGVIIKPRNSIPTNSLLG